MKYLDASAVVSRCEQYRYVLYRQWDAALPTILWLGLNPSVARGLDDNGNAVDDHTVRKVVGFSHRWGFGAFTLGNLFGYRSTDADALLVPGRDIVGPKNDEWLDLLIEGHQHIILAWGAHHPNLVESRMPALTAILARHHRVAWCLGTNRGGQPKHPLMLGYDTPREPIEWATT